jgi:hypothetical protein
MKRGKNSRKYILNFLMYGFHAVQYSEDIEKRIIRPPAVLH